VDGTPVRAGARRLIGVALAAAVVAVGPARADDQPRRLRIGFARIEGDDIALVRAQAARFAAAHPGVEVEVVGQRQRRTTSVHDLWARYLALGDPSIDVYVIDDPWVAEFAFAGWIRPLDELDGWARAELHPAGLRTALWGNRLYAVPLELSANGLFYRRDLLAAAGLQPPTSLDELLAQARRLRGERGLGHGLVMHLQSSFCDIDPFLWASGGGPLHDGRVGLADRVAVEVLTRLRAETGPGGALAAPEQLRAWREWPSEYHTAVEAFAAGDAPFMINWIRVKVAGLPADAVGIAPIPGLAGSGPGTSATLGSWFWAVNAASRNPDLAVELISFLSSEAATLERFETLGTYPPLARFYDDPAWARRHPELAVAGRIFANAQPRMPVANERQVDELIEDAFGHILIDGAPVEATLAAAAADASAAIAAFPDHALVLPDDAGVARHRGRTRGRLVLIVAAAMWVVALAALAIGARAARRRGGLFKRLGTKLSTLGLATVLLALTTGTAVALAVLVQNQDEAIGAAQDIFRASIREHSQSLGRQIALGASVVREVSTSAGTAVIEDARARGDASPDLAARHADTLAKLERGYEESLDVLAAEGAYNRDILLLQIVDPDGTIIVDERDFLEHATSGTGGERPQVDDPVVRDVARFGRRLSMRDVPAAGGRPAYLEVMVPLVQNGRPAGAVRIAYSKQRQEQRIAALRARQERLLSSAVALVSVAALGLIGLSTMLLLLFSRSVSRPLVRLSHLADQVGAGDLTVHAEVPGRDEVAGLAVRLNQMVVGLRERQTIREALGRYVGPSVSDVILAGQVELGGEERVVTLLFSDVRGFTAMSETMSPPEVVKVLNTYFEQMVESVFAHDGMLDKFIGDGLMAVFGAPRDQPDHALAAVRCAVDMRARLVAVNATLRAAGLHPLQIGIGLHTGPVVVGNIGSSKRTEYTAIGDTVNLAARLEGQTKELATDILMSEDTHAAVAAHVDADRVGPIQVKGKQKGVVVYALRALLDPPQPAAGDAGDPPPVTAS